MHLRFVACLVYWWGIVGNLLVGHVTFQKGIHGESSNLVTDRGLRTNGLASIRFI